MTLEFQNYAALTHYRQFIGKHTCQHLELLNTPERNQ